MPGPLLCEKLHDISVVYEAFQQEIQEKYITAEEILDVLCRVLPRSELIRKSVVTLDGYTGSHRSSTGSWNCCALCRNR